jgi:hypothetical protein
MTGADLLSTISTSLIKATQLSYVENAPGTRSILEKLNSVLRYTEQKPGDVRLNEEWAIMMIFLELQRIQNPVRFTYDMFENGKVSEAYIPRCRLLFQLHNEFQRNIEQSDGLLSFSLQLVSASPLKVELTITSNGLKRLVQWK